MVLNDIPDTKDEIKVIFEKGNASKRQWQEFIDSPVWRDIKQWAEDSIKVRNQKLLKEREPVEIYTLQGSAGIFEAILELPEQFLADELTLPDEMETEEAERIED